MTGEISFNLEDVEFFLTQLQQLDETLKQEWLTVCNQWENLSTTWNDQKFEEFEELFQDLSDTYQQSQDECEKYINFLNKQINAAILIDLGLPSLLVIINYASLPADSWVVRNFITNLEHVKDSEISNPEAARKKLSNVFVTTALGDQGELATLIKLINEFGTDILADGTLWNNKKCRQENLQNKKGEFIEPDFYLPSQNLICDAKAYKKLHKKNDLRKTIDKYADALDKGGEVRLYFPKDTYEREKGSFEKLENGYDKSDVKVKIEPMKENHSDLKLMRGFLYNYFKFKAKEDY